MKRILKQVIKNLIVFAIILGLAFDAGLAETLTSFLSENIIAYAEDGGFVHGNPYSSWAGGIMSTPGYDHPPVKISLYRDSSAAFRGQNGTDLLYEYMSNGFPLEQYTNNTDFYIMTVDDSFYNSHFAGKTHEFTYDPSSGILVDNGVSNNKVFNLGGIASKPANNSGVYYQALKGHTKDTLLANWKALTAMTGNVETCKKTLAYIVGSEHDGGVTTFAVNTRFNEVFNPENLDYGESDFWSEAQSSTAWYRYLDALMTLYTIAPGDAKSAWEQAIEDYINGNNLESSPVIICVEQAVGMSLESGAYAGILTIADYLSYVTQTGVASTINSDAWFSNTNKVTHDSYNMFLECANNGMVEEPGRDQGRQTLCVGVEIANAFNWGRAALTKHRIYIDLANRVAGYSGGVATAYIESMALTNKDKSKRMYGYTLFPMPIGTPGSSLGKLEATPDNYTISSLIIPVHVSLNLYSGIDEKDLGTWTQLIESANQSGYNFTIKVDWTRTTSDVNGSAKIMPSPTTVVYSPSQMMEWVTGRKAITAYDATTGQQIKSGKSKAELSYTANIKITVGNKEITGIAADTASFKVQLARIGYTSTPQAYAEFKNYGVNSNMSGTLSEDFEAMAGVPSTEQMYFAAGGSEFIVDITLNETSDEVARRTYDYYFAETKCEFIESDNSKTHTLGGVTVNTHDGGHYKAAQTWSGTDACVTTYSTCSAGHQYVTGCNDIHTQYDAALAAAQAYADAINATILSYTSGSDQLTRSKSGWGAHVCSTRSGGPSPGNAGSVCSNTGTHSCDGMHIDTPAVTDPITGAIISGPTYKSCDASACSAGSACTGHSYEVWVEFDVPSHCLCGPCCEHILPEVHDTWTQSVKYDSMEINSIHVWRIDQGAIEGLTDIIGVDVVGASIVRGTPNIFYNIALKNNANYKAASVKNAHNLGSATLQAQAGRLVYSLDRSALDIVEVNLGERTNNCDGLATTTANNVISNGGNGHSHAWADGFIYTNSSEGYNSSHTGSTKHGETAMKLNPRDGLNGQNYVTINTDAKDKLTTEYAEFVARRNNKNTATMVTDFLILQTSSGDQSVMYFDKTSQEAYADGKIPDIELGNLYSHGGALKGGSIANTCWFNNANSAASWGPYQIGLGSYTGQYWTGTSKFNGTSGGARIGTVFDNRNWSSEAGQINPVGECLVMGRPVRESKLMIYAGELNIELNNQNEDYTTGYSETFWSNQLHWNNKVYTRDDGSGNTISPYSSLANNTSNAPYETNIYRFKGNTTKYIYASGKTLTSSAAYNDTKAQYQFGINDYVAESGYILKSIYSDGYSKCNDIIVHDPVSTEDTALVSLEDYRDQRTEDTVSGGAADIINQLNQTNVCPGEPGLCDYRTLNCTYYTDTVLFNADFDTKQGEDKFINKVTGNAVQCPAGFSLAKNNKLSGYALSAFGTRLSIPFTELGINYEPSVKLRVEADIVISPNGKDQMIFSFNTFDIYLPASDELGLNGNDCLTINTGNGWERKVNTPIADGKKHHLAVDFSFSQTDSCKVYIDGVESSYTRINTSRDLDSSTIGNSLNIGSWLYNDNYGAGFWLDDLKVTRLAGTSYHTDECYNVTMTHPSGLNAHKHTEECLADEMNTIDGMLVKVEDGRTWGRVFYHNTLGGFFTSESEALNTNTTYKYSILDQIQDIKSPNESKYVFMLYYPETGQKNIWKQSKRPQDDIIADGDGTVKATGYEAISIGMSGNYWGGLTRSTTNVTLIDGSVNHGDWFYAIGSYSQWGTGARTIPGGDNASVNEVELWMAVDSKYTSGNTTFTYTGNVQTYTVPANGYYQLEAWGASGGGNDSKSTTLGSRGGQGGYTYGTTYLTKGTVLYIYVGGAGSLVNDWTEGGYNGGGGACYAGNALGTGGGASDIRLVGGLWNNTESLKSRILVAGGGGGADDTGSCSGTYGGGNDESGGNGGGINGQGAYTAGSRASYGFGTQYSGGVAASGGVSGGFGYGGGSTNAGDYGGGGGGYYGGASGGGSYQGGGGGSSYVTGYVGCDTTYRAYQGNYTFSNVVMMQGGNVGNGKVRITKMSNIIDDLLNGLNTGSMSEEELKYYLGDAYEYIKNYSEMTTLYTYSNWSTSTNGFYSLASKDITMNSNGTFTINSTSGWECGVDTAIDGEALRQIIITYKAGCAPSAPYDTGIGINNASTYLGGTSTVNENGETVVTIDIGTALSGKTVNNIWFDLGSGNASGYCTVKQIDIRGYGTAWTQTEERTVSSASQKGEYTYYSNYFGPTTYTTTLVGAGGGNARQVNTTTVVANSGGAGATVTAKAVFNKGTKLNFVVGGKGGDQASVAQVGGFSSWTEVKRVSTAGTGSYTFKANTPYRIEMYGASGGGASIGTGASHGGYGGYTTGVLKFNTAKTVYYYVGGQGTASSAYGTGGGYNGGGQGGPGGYGGGGMTHLSTTQNLASSSVADGGTSSGSQTFYYTGGVQSFTAPADGEYTFKLYGARGGYSLVQGSWHAGYGYGGYTTGTRTLTKGQTIYIQVGGAGGNASLSSWAAGGWNGGGRGSNDGGGGSSASDDEASGGGGGATSITLTNRGVLANFASYTTEVIAVAGGGGGASYDYSAGSGGGTNGGADGHGTYATQTSGYAFGQGQNGSGSADSDGVAGGGGGWYGGYSYNISRESAGGGGSGYTGGLSNGSMSNGVNNGNGYAIISWNINNIASSASWDSTGTLMVAGGGGGADNGGGTVGGGDDGSGGNGGGATAGNALIDGVAQAGTGATQSSGYIQGAGQSATAGGDTGGAGAGWYGGKVTNNNNGGAGGGSGYINTSYVTSFGGVTAQTSTSAHIGDGVIIIYEGSFASTARPDGLGGYNGGGTGGIEYEEGYPESAAGGGGATHLATASGLLSSLKDNKSAVLLVAAGGGGAASHLTDSIAYGGNAGAPDGSTTNNYTIGATQTNGYAFGLGQNGADGVRANNYGAVGGGGGGYYGGKQVSSNLTGYAVGGAGGSSYVSSIFSASSMNVSGNHSDGSYVLNEHREVLHIDSSNFKQATTDILMKYYTLIPDTLPDGSDNPVWENCTHVNNYHKCDASCQTIKVLTCSEPHHKGLHYDITNDICWDACNNDANHKKQQLDTADIGFTPGNFINIDYGFTIFFPNRGEFEEGQSYAIGGLTSAKGKGYTDIYSTAAPYGRGTENSNTYLGKAVGMNTSKWTRVKRIKFDVNVIYNGVLYLSGEWITLGDRGTYTGTIGKIGNEHAYDETKWSNYGTDLYNGIYKEYYDFYCVLANSEAKAATYTVEVTALNAKDFNASGDSQINDNKVKETNKARTSSFSAYHGGINKNYYDVVGRIGNIIMEDIEDFRFSNLFKEAVNNTGSTVIDSKTFLVNSGLSLSDTAGTENGAQVSGNYIVTNGTGQYAAVKGFSADKAYYKVEIQGKGLNAGRLSVVKGTDTTISDERFELIQTSSSVTSYYLDLSEESSLGSIDIKYIAKGSNVMAVEKIIVTKLGDSPDKWLLDGIVSEVDSSKQNMYLSWVADIRGIKVSNKTNWVDTWGTLDWVNENRIDLPLSPDKNNIAILQTEPMLTGYSAYMDIQTIGNYWANNTGTLQIIPKYYAIDLKTDELYKLDVYMEHNGSYVPINIADNVDKNSTNLYKTEIHNNIINLDWESEKTRRNVTDSEERKTLAVYESTLIADTSTPALPGEASEATDNYRPIDVPGGHINTLGCNQYLQLDGSARTFVGGESTYGVLKNIGNRIGSVAWYRQAQRWHFSIGLPSSSVFIKHGLEFNDKNMIEISNGDYIILCALDITAVGDTYALKYNQKYSGTVANDEKGTDTGESTPYMGYVTVKTKDGVMKTINLGNYGAKLNYEPVVFVYNPSDSSRQDVEIIGTH